MSKDLDQEVREARLELFELVYHAKYSPETKHRIVDRFEAAVRASERAKQTCQICGCGPVCQDDCRGGSDPSCCHNRTIHPVFRCERMRAGG